MVLTYHIAGSKSCGFFEKSVKHAEYVAENASKENITQIVVKPQSFDSLDGYKTWLSTAKINAPTSHTTSPAIWTTVVDGGEPKFIGGFDTLGGSLETATGGRVWSSGVKTKEEVVRMNTMVSMYGLAIPIYVIEVVSMFGLAVMIAIFCQLTAASENTRLWIKTPILIGTLTGGQAFIGS